jgi:acyl-coenzyme A synthetase/AMP-(fatty) acid ligase
VIEERFGVKVRELYGMTETGGWVSMNTGGATRAGSVGRPRAGVEVRILDDEKLAVGPDLVGEIVARSEREDLFFTEYWRDADATNAVLRDSWLFTGDRGHLDEDGFLYFDGRSKDLIRRAGEMISPVEIERALLGNPSVVDCAVAGLADLILGEEIVAAVVVSGPTTTKSLQDSLRGTIPEYMIPSYFIFVEQIPRTETTKVKRFEVAEMVSRERSGHHNSATRSSADG